MSVRKFAVLPIVFAAVALTACSSTLSVPGPDLAELAEDALEKQVGKRPDITCGEDDIEVVKDKQVTCQLNDPATGSQYDTIVTFTSVDGNKYEIGVEVAEGAE